LIEWWVVRRPSTRLLLTAIPFAVLVTLVGVREEGVTAAAISGAITASVTVVVWVLLGRKTTPETFRRLTPHQRLAAFRALESAELPGEPEVAQATIDLSRQIVRRPPRLGAARTFFVGLLLVGATMLVVAIIRQDWVELAVDGAIVIGAVWLLVRCPRQQQSTFEHASRLLEALPSGKGADRLS
jgi:hypothetical protein